MTTATVNVCDYYGEQRPSAIFYDLVESMYRPIEPEVAFYLDVAKSISTPILEVGCGTGRIAWSLAESRHEVLGVDIAAAMLDRARRKGSLYPDNIARRVRFLMGDMCSINLETTFDLVLAPYRVFDHLPTVSSQRSFLTNIRRHLSAGGRVVFDTTQPTHEQIGANHRALSDNKVFAVDIPHLGINLERQIIDIKMDIPNQTMTLDACYTMKTESGDAHTHVDRLMLRWASPLEIRLMLEQTGFRLVAEYQDFTRSPPNGIGDRVWVAEASGG